MTTEPAYQSPSVNVATSLPKRSVGAAVLLVPVGVRLVFTTGPGPESGCSKPSIG